MIVHDLVQVCNVNSPGGHKPEGSCLKVRLDGRHKIARLAFSFHSPTLISPNSDLSFTFKANTADLIKPDILKGDIGFPEINIENEIGEVYRLKRGNSKDFLDIHNLSVDQFVLIPLTVFIYNIDLRNNSKFTTRFWQYPIVKISFDFLSSIGSVIELLLKDVRIVPRVPQPVDLQDLVVIQKAGKPDPCPTFVTESPRLSLSFQASHLVPFFCSKPLTLIASISSSKDSGKSLVALSDTKEFVEFWLPYYGQHSLSLALKDDTRTICETVIPVVRAIACDSRFSKLGISDSAQFGESLAVAGALRRTVLSLKSFAYESGSFRLLPNHGVILDLPCVPGLQWIVALKGMPRWLSKEPDKHDYHRYGPKDLKLFRKFVRYIVTSLAARGVRYIEPWNEANVIHEWNDSIEALVEIQSIYYEESRGLDIVILSPSTTSWDFPFFQKLLDHNIHTVSDALALHGYTYEPSKYQSFIADAKKLHELSNLQLYITEIGFRHPSFSEFQQSLYLALFTVEACFNEFIGACVWFRFQNHTHETTSTYNQNSSTGYAMLGYHSSYARSMYSAFQASNHFLHSVVPREIIRDDDSSLYLGSIVMEPGSKIAPIAVSYCPQSIHLLAREILLTGSAYDLFGNPVSGSSISKSQLLYILDY